MKREQIGLVSFSVCKYYAVCIICKLEWVMSVAKDEESDTVTPIHDGRSESEPDDVTHDTDCPWAVFWQSHGLLFIL